MLKTFTTDFSSECEGGESTARIAAVAGKVGSDVDVPTVVSKVISSAVSRLIGNYMAVVVAGGNDGRVGGGEFALVAAALEAIVDSGASKTYVPSTVKLTDTRPGGGFVATAEGRRRAIVETGSYGPLLNAQKVPGFTRVLVSVLDLAEQFGVVTFDTKGVYVASGAVVTQIGAVTPSRLYSFDLSALRRHVQLVK